MPDKATNFLWIYDIPMFRKNGNNNQLESIELEHPYAEPHPDDMELMYDRITLDCIRSQSFKLVLNGRKVGQGFIGIHDADMQKWILKDLLGRSMDGLDRLIEILESGCPPYGDITIGEKTETFNEQSLKYILILLF